MPLTIHSVAQVREMDRYAIDQLGVPGFTLMTRAGEAALAALQVAWPMAEKVLVVCGNGNNAGDGYVLARMARAVHLDVTVLASENPAGLKGDALTAYLAFTAAGGRANQWTADASLAADVIVDALFGTGLSRDLDDAWCKRVAAVNAAGAPILSIDVPSGIDAQTGQIRGAAIRADRTIVLGGLKIGLYQGAGQDCAGTLVFDDLSLPKDVAERAGHVAERIDTPLLRAALPQRRRAAHKGDYGHVLVLAGGLGMAGAARLAGEACLRSGAGRVTVATRAANVAAITAGRPELMTCAVESSEDLVPLLKKIDLIAVGPGLGQDAWAQSVFAAAMGAGKPLVVDADALHFVATSGVFRQDWILTPHPGEAARLLGTTPALIQADRVAAARKLADRYGGVAVLKGAGTVVDRSGAVPQVCDYGNPGMATAGMGDVLTGVIAAMVAQTPDLWTAARAGVLAHAMAGDAAARRGERGLLAGDVIAHLAACVNPTR
jgi:ADP-dependent NAD(P)H-hydrate dehydratase / NAD(P)H-hydrate epimerase